MVFRDSTAAAGFECVSLIGQRKGAESSVRSKRSVVITEGESQPLHTAGERGTEKGRWHPALLSCHPKGSDSDMMLFQRMRWSDARSRYMHAVRGRAFEDLGDKQ